MPRSFSVSATLSTLQFTQQGGGQEPVTSNNRQIDAILARPVRRHTLQTEWREIRLDGAASAQRQRFWQAGDNYQMKHFSVGGAVRHQRAETVVEQNSIFFRGLAQATLGRLSAYANVEVGNDLANQTLFSTSAYRTSMARVTWRIARGWNLAGGGLSQYAQSDS